MSLKKLSAAKNGKKGKGKEDEEAGNLPPEEETSEPEPKSFDPDLLDGDEPLEDPFEVEEFHFFPTDNYDE